jgi:large subunit ribosomal protein L15
VPEKLNLSTLKPVQRSKEPKRVGRGLGSGKGRYSGRGIKGQKSRSGSHAMRAGFEGGQMPLYMRLGKQRGSTSKDAMPVGPFRTRTYHVNLRDLEARFEAGDEVTPETLVEKGLIRNTRYDVKLLGQGDLTKKLTITVHRASASAREKIEATGAKLTVLRDEDPPKKRRRKAKEKPMTAAAETTAAAEDKVGEPDPALGETVGAEKVPEGEG